MARKVGKDCKVALGSSTVVGMGTWSLDGIVADQFESTAFGDNWKTYEYGAKDGGTISFDGFFDPTDTTGQIALQLANLSNGTVTNIKLYVDNTSYYEPCQTTGYFSPSYTTGYGTQLSNVRITSFNVKADKSGLLTTNFSAKVSGVMVLI
jgi:hypothetical protein